MVTAMKEVSQTLQCFGETTQAGLHTTQESLRLQKQNTDILLQLKEEMRKQDENENYFKREIEDLNKTVATLTQENTDLKIQIGNKDQMVLDQDMKLGEFQKRVQELEQQVTKLNNTVQNMTPVCWACKCEQQPHLDKIKPVVQAFVNHSDWNTLKRDLDDLLDHSSEEYTQLQTRSLHFVGYYNSIQLASLLLCAGLPVETTDYTGDNMLHAAAGEGHLDLVKLLLERGAGVDVKGQDGDTPLIDAAYYGHLEMVQYLVQAGADTTIRNNKGNTALYYARYYDHTEIIQFLEKLPQ